MLNQKSLKKEYNKEEGKRKAKGTTIGKYVHKIYFFEKNHKFINLQPD